MAVPVPSICWCVFNNHNFFFQEQNALAFNRCKCCHLALCLRLITFHSNRKTFLPCKLMVNDVPGKRTSLFLSNVSDERESYTTNNLVGSEGPNSWSSRLKKVSNVCNIKSSWFKLVSTRRCTEPCPSARVPCLKSFMFVRYRLVIHDVNKKWRHSGGRLAGQNWHQLGTCHLSKKVN